MKRSWTILEWSWLILGIIVAIMCFFNVVDFEHAALIWILGDLFSIHYLLRRKLGE